MFQKNKKWNTWADVLKPRKKRRKRVAEAIDEDDIEAQIAALKAKQAKKNLG